MGIKDRSIYSAYYGLKLFKPWRNLIFERRIQSTHIVNNRDTEITTPHYLQLRRYLERRF